MGHPQAEREHSPGLEKPPTARSDGARVMTEHLGRILQEKKEEQVNNWVEVLLSRLSRDSGRCR